MRDFSIENNILIRYTGTEQNVEIPKGIIKIESEAFRECSNLISVSIPDTVKEIGYDAFRACRNLKNVTLCPGLENIGAGAFSYCAGLESLILPETVKLIDWSAFLDCCSLKKVIIPATVTVKNYYVNVRPVDGIFNGCNNLKSAGPIGSGCDIEFGWTESIPNLAFYGSELNEVIIPETISYIGYLAFRRCAAEMKVSLPSYCLLGEKAFDRNVRMKISNRINSKEKIVNEYLEYADIDFINRFSSEELAWILLYQSKKWRTAVLENLSLLRAEEVQAECQNILCGVKRLSKGIIEAVEELSQKINRFKENEKVKQYFKGKTEVGEIITYGMYAHKYGRKPEPIEWLILYKEDDRILVISKHCLEVLPYNKIRKKVSWKNCNLRKWLNETFYKTAFSEDEQRGIDNMQSDIITLLSEADVKRYFKDYTQCVATATEYIKEKGLTTLSHDECMWWLRSTEGSGNKASFVSAYDLSYIELEGDGFDQVISDYWFVDDAIGVRPVMWLWI